MPDNAKQSADAQAKASEDGLKLYKRIEMRSKEMEQLRAPYDPMRCEITTLLRPELSMYNQPTSHSSTGNQNNEVRPNEFVWSGAPQEGLETWSAGWQGQTATASFEWFKVIMEDDELNSIPIVREWLQHVEARQYALLNRSNYYQHLAPIFRDVGSYGDGASWIEETRDGKSIACTNFHLKECFGDEDSQGNVNTFYRFPYEMSARNAVEKFGKDNLSSDLVKAYNGTDPLKRFKFLHATHERNDPIFKGLEHMLPDGRQWVSVYLELGVPDNEKKPIRIRGYFTRPFSYWRFTKSPGSFYGCGLGCFALVDIFGINNFTEIMLRSGHLAVDPAMYVHEDMRGQAHVDPGSWVFGSKDQDIPKVVFEGGKYPAGIDTLERATLAIERWFNVDMFQQINRLDKQMTIPELMARLSEKAVILGPKIGRLNNDLYTPQHERIFDIQFRNKWINPPPPELLERINEGDGFQLQYNGVLERAQRQQREIQRTELFVGQVRPLVELKPDVVDLFDIDGIAVRVARESGLPEKEIFPEEVVKQTRTDRAQQEAAAAQAEMLLEAAKVAPQMNQAPEEGSPAQQLQEAEA